MAIEIRLGQIKAVPKKGALAANHAKLMLLLQDLDSEKLDVIITPEGFLDGYVSTEKHVTRENSDVFIAFTHPLQSLVTSPKGQVICNDEADKDTVTISRVDLSKADEARARATSQLKNRRPDLYER